MKTIIAGVFTLVVFAALHIPITKKKKGIILVSYAIGMIMFFVVYNFRTMDYIIRMFHPVDQSVYQKEFLETGEYPDAFLDLFLHGRTVYTPNDAYTVSDTVDPTEDTSSDMDEDGNYWLYDYYHAVNMWQYLEFNRNSVIKDDSLNDVILTDDQKSYFEDLGIANDMMRYTFVLTPYLGEWGNGFYHYWFYSSFNDECHVYICPEDILEADELVVIWQQVENANCTDDYYIASKAYYDEVISK